jgi:hypothetical protein
MTRTKEQIIELFRQEKKRMKPSASFLAKVHVVNNVLIIGDLHQPFTKQGYLEHCIHIYKKYKCNKVISIGDLIDQHFSSYHETDPDGLSAGDELDRAVEGLQAWKEAFPVVDVCVGNHDLLAQRKIFSAGVSKKWLKPFEDVLNLQTWSFKEHYIYDNVLYTHGTGTRGQNAAYNRMMNRGISTVQGHLHTEGSIRYNATNEALRFSMQVGCGVDEAAYAMEYGKNFTKKMILSCGVVLNNGQLPILEPLKLEK